MAELLRMLRELLLDRVGQEGRHLGAAGRQRADREADGRCRAATASRSAASPPASSRASPCTGSISSGLPLEARGHVQRLADREQADGERRDLDAVEQLGHAEGQARLAGELVDADEARAPARATGWSARARASRRRSPTR